MPLKIQRLEPQTTIRTKGDFQGHVECSISSSVRVDGDENWLSFRATLPINEGESHEDAFTRITTEVLQGFESFVTEAVHKIQEMSKP